MSKNIKKIKVPGKPKNIVKSFDMYGCKIQNLKVSLVLILLI